VVNTDSIESLNGLFNQFAPVNKKPADIIFLSRIAKHESGKQSLS
jgi:hypothetical protein